MINLKNLQDVLVNRNSTQTLPEIEPKKNMRTNTVHLKTASGIPENIFAYFCNPSASLQVLERCIVSDGQDGVRRPHIPLVAAEEMVKKPFVTSELPVISPVRLHGIEKDLAENT